MNITIVLDTGPLGMVSNPQGSGETLACKAWLNRQLSVGRRVVIPEIADYEVRRELRRAGKFPGLQRLDDLGQLLEYVPLTTATMRQAADLWAQARSQGKPTAPDAALDGDVILAAQRLLLDDYGGQVIVATGNVAHLSLFVNARLWQSIS
jgi:predicted nucleic acid-binding protein